MPDCNLDSAGVNNQSQVNISLNEAIYASSRTRLHAALIKKEKEKKNSVITYKDGKRQVTCQAFSIGTGKLYSATQLSAQFTRLRNGSALMSDMCIL